MTSVYTCITCRIAFHDSNVQRQHYKSDWHRYNLKRKVIEFPPITAEDFQNRVIVQCNVVGKDTELQSLDCRACKKHFNTKNQYDNHLASKKHKEKYFKLKNTPLLNFDESMKDCSEGLLNFLSNKKLENIEKNLEYINNIDIDLDIESVDSDQWIEDTDNPILKNNCLFCNHHSKSWVRNLKHMSVEHSFFIPDPEFCIDIKGLLMYLGQKIFAGYMCLWCNNTGKLFRSVDAARAHMLDKGHCKMLHEGEALVEYTEFYDYSSSYPDNETSDPNEEVEIPKLNVSQYHLVLPSGSIIGHRSLMRFYKQSLNSYHALNIPKSAKLNKVLNIYRSLGWTKSQKELIKQKVIDIRYMERIKQKYSTILNFKANKLQTHFRQQVNF